MMVMVKCFDKKKIPTPKTYAGSRVQDYRESKKLYRNYVITFKVIGPIKRDVTLMSHSKFFSIYHAKILLSSQIIDLEFLYLNLLFKVLFDAYWDCYKQITGHYRSF